MTNIDKLNKIFCEVFNVDGSALGKGFDKDSVDGWDSVRQLSLTSSLEDTFDIMLDPEDIIIEMLLIRTGGKYICKFILF